MRKFLLALTMAASAGMLAGCLHLERNPGEWLGGQPYSPPLAPAETALDRYVAAPDPAYSWSQAGKFAGEGVTTYLLEMTSQTWLTPDRVDRPQWDHFLLVTVPKDVRHSTALLMIGGGSNTNDPPDSGSSEMEAISLATGSVTATLRMVPNQPLRFAGDEEGRYEDDLIAYAWEQYMLTGDVTWLPRLPMTKAAVRAMDAVQSFCSGPVMGGKRVEDFVVTGGSKRGWTTWTTAAVDSRVKAVVPVVIDMLNMMPSFEHHWRTLGFWAPAVGDYERHGIMDWTGTPEYRMLAKIVEPYSYRDRLTMPKLVINATGDQFFLPDSSQFYWDGLTGPKYLRYVPNGDHSLRETDGRDSVLAFYSAILEDADLPEYTWDFPDKNTIEVRSDTPVREVLLWQAHNPAARDFRVEAIGRVWASSPVQDLGGGLYRATVPTPAAGWTAYMLELTFDSPADVPLKLSTPVRIVPDVLPFEYSLPDPPRQGFLSQAEE